MPQVSPMFVFCWSLQPCSEEGKESEAHTHLSINLFSAVFSQNVINHLQTTGQWPYKKTVTLGSFLTAAYYGKAAVPLILIFKSLFRDNYWVKETAHQTFSHVKHGNGFLMN